MGRRVSVRPSAVAIFLAVLICGTVGAGRPASRAVALTRPNIVLILTDDQRYDELQHMPTVQSQLTDRGVDFTRGFVSNPLCCPSRATILTGQYSGTNGVWSNTHRLHGGFTYFNDTTTIATVLQQQGYHTGLIGKYLNGYSLDTATYEPPGWDQWFALTGPLNYYGPTASDNGQPVQYDPSVYQTDLLGQQAVDFIDNTPADQPLFMYWAPHAPHRPADPSPQYNGVLAGDPPYRSAAYNEADVSDKPQYIQKIPSWGAKEQADEDLLYEHMQESLLSVDDWVKQILSALEETGRLNNTLIVFMSDNGWMAGDHRWQAKQVPYEGSIRVPFIVRWDAAGWTPREDTHLIGNVDLAETWADAAGTSMPGGQGASLLPLLSGATSSWRFAFLLEHYGLADRPSYCGVRTSDHMYTQYQTGEEELYNLQTDPWEMDNLAADPSSEPVLAHLRQVDHRLCDPPPPDFVWSH